MATTTPTTTPVQPPKAPVEKPFEGAQLCPSNWNILPNDDGIEAYCSDGRIFVGTRDVFNKLLRG